MKRYRTSMTYTIDVWAESENDAVDIGHDVFWDMPHTWHPNSIVVLDSNDKSFTPCNDWGQ